MLLRMNSKFKYLTDQFKYNFDFVINIKNEELPEINKERKYSPIDRSLRRELKSVFGSTNYWFDTTSYEDVVEIKVKSADKLIEIVFPKEKIAPIFSENFYSMDYSSLIIINFNCNYFFKKSN
jgi:hypothetical protein